MAQYALGLDIGGTFTDIVVYDQDGAALYSHKELTTPEAPHRGVVAGIKRLFEAERLAYRDVTRMVHATTLFTNALIERKGAVTGLITTEGFRDTLEMRREHNTSYTICSSSCPNHSSRVACEPKCRSALARMARWK